jgi:hypothetical protein
VAHFKTKTNQDPSNNCVCKVTWVHVFKWQKPVVQFVNKADYNKVTFRASHHQAKQTSNKRSKASHAATLQPLNFPETCSGYYISCVVCQQASMATQRSISQLSLSQHLLPASMVTTYLHHQDSMVTASAKEMPQPTTHWWPANTKTWLPALTTTTANNMT